LGQTNIVASRDIPNGAYGDCTDPFGNAEPPYIKELTNRELLPRAVLRHPELDAQCADKGSSSRARCEFLGVQGRCAGVVA